MKQQNYTLTKYTADDGKVFDWKEPRFVEIDGKQVQEHLYAEILFIGTTDSINNYVEVVKPLVDDLLI